MRQRILIVDDEPSLHRLVGRALGSERYELLAAADGGEGLALALSQAPELVLLDIKMPGRSGWEVLRELRANPHTRLLPIIMLTGQNTMDDEVRGLEAGADDYIAKPFVPAELCARVDSLLRRNRQAVAASPLTGLAGSPTIEAETRRRIEEGAPLAFLYADIDRFKPYNDVFGFAQGDRVIRETGELLLRSLDAEGAAGDFVGHVGGDDFVLLTVPERAAHLAQWIVREFDRKVPEFCPASRYPDGYMEAEDRQGNRRRFPPLSLSIGIVTNERDRLESYGQIVRLACEMKNFCKAAPLQRLSRFAFDRRHREGE